MPATYASLYFHLIFATKGRAPLLQPEIRSRLHGYLAGCAKNLGAVPLAIGGVEDHVHLLVSTKTTHCIADFARDLKRSATVWMQREMGMPSFAWQEGYGVFTVGFRGLDRVREYIANQEERHKTVDSRSELLSICRELGVEVDMRYFE
ncbi:MAG: IS200/IS605 family transposase [Armatimonadetes bacterium]|nr:IS200/IS605 family transposase [Armatimonadota bacterium]